jgi:hypothetical protein
LLAGTMFGFMGILCQPWGNRYFAPMILAAMLILLGAVVRRWNARYEFVVAALLFITGVCNIAMLSRRGETVPGRNIPESLAASRVMNDVERKTFLYQGFFPKDSYLRTIVDSATPYRLLILNAVNTSTTTFFGDRRRHKVSFADSSDCLLRRASDEQFDYLSTVGRSWNENDDVKGRVASLGYSEISQQALNMMTVLDEGAPMFRIYERALLAAQNDSIAR